MEKNRRRSQGRRQVKTCGVDTHGERRAQANNVEPPAGAEPPARSRGRPRLHSHQGAKPSEAENV